MKQIEQGVIEATGKKRVIWREWTVVGLADDNSTGIQTGMPYSPPDDDRQAIGFKRTKKR